MILKDRPAYPRYVINPWLLYRVFNLRHYYFNLSEVRTDSVRYGNSISRIQPSIPPPVTLLHSTPQTPHRDNSPVRGAEGHAARPAVELHT